MKKFLKITVCTLVIAALFSACNNNDWLSDVPDTELFYVRNISETVFNEPCIYNLKSGKSNPITVENYENFYMNEACGYYDGEFFAYYDVENGAEILKIKDGKVVATHSFEAKFKVPENWEFSHISILSIARYKDGVLVLSPNADPYSSEPFYADMPSTLYYIDFTGLCEPILENVVSFKVYEDKICYCAFDEIKLAEYGNTTIYSKFNINIYQNGKSKELFSSELCPYESVEDWCDENELLLIKDGDIVKYNIETKAETMLLKPKFYYSFEKGKSVYVSDKYILACAKKQDLITLDSDVSYLYLFNVESRNRIIVSQEITGTYDAPFEIA